MDNCYINLGAVKAKEIDGELYISCWNFSKVLSEKEREISDLCKENDELEKQISELESELAVKEDLLKIVTERYYNLLLDSLCVTGIDEDINCGEEPLPFSSEGCEKCSEEELEDLRERHQQDCITIKQLHTTIDTLVDRYAKLREIIGL